MQRPLMTAEQSNVPQNEEEMRAATAKREAAEAVEQQAHAAARRVDAVAATRLGAIARTTRELQRVLYEQAEAAGVLPQHINATLFSAAVIAANAQDGIESVLTYIRSLAVELKAAHPAAQGEAQ